MIGGEWIWRGLKFREITGGDISYLQKILKSEIRTENAVREILIHQLVNSSFLHKIPAIDSEELRSLTIFFRDHDSTFRESFPKTEDIFDSIMYDIAKTLTKFEESIKDALRQTTISSSLQHIELLKKTNQDIIQTKELFQTMIDKWASHTQFLLENLSKFNDTLNPKNRTFLLENGWIISPFLLQKHFEAQFRSEDTIKLTNKQLNTIYINFFIKNDFNELEQMILSWQRKNRYKERTSIFMDCIAIMKTFKHNGKNHKRNKVDKPINPDRVVLPILIAQIDGITTEYAKANGLIPDGVHWLDKDHDLVKNGKHKCLLETPLNNGWGVSAIELLLNNLFAKAYTSGQLNPKKHIENPKDPPSRPFLQFSRHKIMHGETLRFGQIDNVIRTFLILDFLAHLK